MRSVRSIAAAAATVAISVSATVAGSAGSASAAAAGTAQARVFTGSDDLFSVAATGTANAWAVGAYFVGTPGHLHQRPLIERWNGAKWRLAASPRIGATSGWLESVAASSARNAWAVGTQGSKALIEHWTGSSWHLVAGAAIGGRHISAQLAGVAIASAKSVWAVGSVYTARGLHPLIEHWNGTKWSVVTSPDPGGLAAGDYLTGVAASKAGVWAVGTSAPGNVYQTLVLARVRGTWRRLTSADPSGTGNWLGAVSAAGTRVLAAGFGGYDNPAVAQSLVLDRTRSGFPADVTPNPGGLGAQDELYGVAASSAGGWAVGRYHAQTLILREQAGVWSQVPSPSWPSPATSLLQGVTTWRGTAWAVGERSMAVGSISVTYTLILRWKNGSWVQVPSPNR
jgi:hypothetical protein